MLVSLKIEHFQFTFTAVLLQQATVRRGWLLIYQIYHDCKCMTGFGNNILWHPFIYIFPADGWAEDITNKAKVSNEEHRILYSSFFVGLHNDFVPSLGFPSAWPFFRVYTSALQSARITYIPITEKQHFITMIIRKFSHEPLSYSLSFDPWPSPIISAHISRSSGLITQLTMSTVDWYVYDDLRGSSLSWLRERQNFTIVIPTLCIKWQAGSYVVTDCTSPIEKYYLPKIHHIPFKLKASVLFCFYPALVGSRIAFAFFIKTTCCWKTIMCRILSSKKK